MKDCNGLVIYEEWKRVIDLVNVKVIDLVNEPSRLAEISPEDNKGKHGMR